MKAGYMKYKSRDKKPKYPSEISMNMHGNIVESMKIKLPNLEKTSNTKNATAINAKSQNQRCEVYDCDIQKLMRLLADIATNLWRARNRKDVKELDSISDNIRKALRHYEAAWDLFINAGFEILDHTNEPYVEGSDLKVIAFQPMSGYGTETVAETIKPTIYFKNQKIQKGEVIVAMPIKDNHTKENNERNK